MCLTKSTLAPQTLKDEILDLLGSADRPLSPSEIAESVSATNDSYVRAELGRLVASHELHRPRRGQYALGPPSQDVSDGDSSPNGAETGAPTTTAVDAPDLSEPAPAGHTRVIEILIEPSASEVWDVGTDEDVLPEEAPSSTIFPDWYIRSEYGVSPERIRFARVRGDSMEPTIRPGQRLVVALLPEGSTLRDSTIYLIHGPGGAQVKRLLIEPDHIHVWSDNPDRPRFKVPLETFERDYRVVAVVLETNNKL